MREDLFGKKIIFIIIKKNSKGFNFLFFIPPIKVELVIGAE